ncbi:hypothetical protein [Ralstonia pseudosolanacearum]|uniref:hypothetical protein n=1 Tax=Ralstonia pseudosolanacearum TaxID=1310165 RepID=UPI001E3344D5|nr:hypothetical protein [Ralstonia pseudosolanacearum]
MFAQDSQIFSVGKSGHPTSSLLRVVLANGRLRAAKKRAPDFVFSFYEIRIQ